MSHFTPLTDRVRTADRHLNSLAVSYNCFRSHAVTLSSIRCNLKSTDDFRRLLLPLVAFHAGAAPGIQLGVLRNPCTILSCNGPSISLLYLPSSSTRLFCDKFNLGYNYPGMCMMHRILKMTSIEINTFGKVVTMLLPELSLVSGCTSKIHNFWVGGRVGGGVCPL